MEPWSPHFNYQEGNTLFTGVGKNEAVSSANIALVSPTHVAARAVALDADVGLHFLHVRPPAGELDSVGGSVNRWVGEAEGWWEASSSFGAKRELASSTVGFLFQNAHKGPPKVKGNSFPASEVYCGKKSPGSRGHSLKF